MLSHVKQTDWAGYAGHRRHQRMPYPPLAAGTRRDARGARDSQVADATPDPTGATAALLTAAIAHGELPQRVLVMGAPADDTGRVILDPVKSLSPTTICPNWTN